MAVKLSKRALDVGIISANGPKMVAFYRDVLGLAQDADVTIPNYGTIHKFNAGDSVLRVMVPVATPENVAGGPFISRNGIRYMTMHIDNLEETVAACRQFGCAGYRSYYWRRPFCKNRRCCRLARRVCRYHFIYNSCNRLRFCRFVLC